MTAFSNSTMWEIWAARWCYVCTKDGIGTPNGDEPYCPILTAALANNEVPAEWTETPGSIQDYTCSEFDRRPDDDGRGDGDPDPQPDPDPTCDAERLGQLDIFGVFADQVIEHASTAPERTKVETCAVDATVRSRSRTLGLPSSSDLTTT